MEVSLIRKQRSLITVFSLPCGRGIVLLRTLMGLLLLAVSSDRSPVAAKDVGTVSLYNSRWNGLLNTWGGAWSAGGSAGVAVDLQSDPSGERVLALELGPTKAGEDRFVQCLAAGFGPSPQYHQTRDLTPYARLDIRVKNAAGAALGGFIELKDYRDSAQHRAVFPFHIPASGGFTRDFRPLESGRSPLAIAGPAGLEPHSYVGLPLHAADGDRLG